MSKYITYTDEQLVALLQNNDETAFTEIYRRYWKLLFSIAANKLPDAADAEEVVQEVFADLWKRKHEINISYSIKSFLAAAAKYQIYSLMAKMSREKQAVKTITDNTVINVQDEIEARHLFDKLYNEASVLPERCFLIYKLSRIKGLNNKEIAEELGIAEKTIEGQLTRALPHLRAAVHFVIAGVATYLTLAGGGQG